MPGTNDGIAKYAFCICAGKERLSDETQLGGVVTVVAGLVGLESGDEALQHATARLDDDALIVVART